MTETSTAPKTPPSTGSDAGAAPDSILRALVGRVARIEIVIGAVIAAVMLVLIVIEPEILEAPFENERTLLFTAGGTGLAAIAFVAMLWLRVPPAVRVIVLVVPFAIVNWWLLSPYFIDDVVDEEFSTSISAQLAAPALAPPAGEAPPVAEALPTTPPIQAGEVVAPSEPVADDAPAIEEEPVAAPVEEELPAVQVPVAEQPVEPAPLEDEPVAAAPVVEEQPAAEVLVEEDPVAVVPVEEEPPPAPTGPVLLGAGQFVGLAGHSGTGDAGIFQNPDGSLVLRFENFDIQNGPDLEVYLVPGAGQTSLAAGSVHLGALKGNVGDQNYQLSAGTTLAPGPYTALVWCEAFSVEFVGATVVI